MFNRQKVIWYCDTYTHNLYTNWLRHDDGQEYRYIQYNSMGNVVYWTKENWDKEEGYRESWGKQNWGDEYQGEASHSHVVPRSEYPFGIDENHPFSKWVTFKDGSRRTEACKGPKGVMKRIVYGSFNRESLDNNLWVEFEFENLHYIGVYVDGYGFNTTGISIPFSEQLRQFYYGHHQKQCPITDKLTIARNVTVALLIAAAGFGLCFGLER